MDTLSLNQCNCILLSIIYPHHPPQNTSLFFLYMEEQHVRPTFNTHEDPQQTPPPPYRSNNTSIVQLPIDRIYRIPTSRNTSTTSNATVPHDKPFSLSILFLWLFFLILILILILIIIFSIFYLALRPKSPKFSIEDYIFTNHHQSNYYKISLLANNTNEHIGIFFKREGITSLSYRQRVIAQGKSPADFYIGKKHTKVFQLVMMPKEIKKEEDARTLTLLMNAPVKFEIWLLKVAWNMKMDIKCDLKLSSLSRGGNGNLVEQQCHGKVKF